MTDQGSNFTSRLLVEIYQMLHIQAIRTSPYHPQTDGLVERFNQTLKLLLRKVALGQRKDWDKLLPYLLFAYREVPQSSTGFSPFELLYGRPVRGPLDIIKETWEVEKNSSENVISHVMSMREKIEEMMEIVQENLKNSQTRQKLWYDKTARERCFQPGEEVLVLMPTTTNKLYAQWQGPYRILCRTGAVNYIIDMHDKQKRKRNFHINMLRKWHAPLSTTCFWTEEVQDEQDEDVEIPVWQPGEKEEKKPLFGPQLSKLQQK